MRTCAASDLYGTTHRKIAKTTKKPRMGCRRTHAATLLIGFESPARLAGPSPLGSLGDSFHQARFAEQAARPEEEHERHEDEDDDLGELGSEERGEPHDLADEQARDDGAEQAAHAADHDDHERLDDDRDAHLGIGAAHRPREDTGEAGDRKSTRLNSSHLVISYAVFC